MQFEKSPVVVFTAREAQNNETVLHTLRAHNLENCFIVKALFTTILLLDCSNYHYLLF